MNRQGKRRMRKMKPSLQVFKEEQREKVGMDEINEEVKRSSHKLYNNLHVSI